MTADEVFEILFNEAAKQGLPEIYQDDFLIHDYIWLQDATDTKLSKFTWVLRTYGTFL